MPARGLANKYFWNLGHYSTELPTETVRLKFFMEARKYNQFENNNTLL